MFEFLGADVLTALFQVVLIDLALAGDNAIVIGLAAAGLRQAQQGKAILIGVVAATILRMLLRRVSDGFQPKACGRRWQDWRR